MKEHMDDHDLLIRIDEKMTNLNGMITKMNLKVDSNNCRIGELERWRTYLAGVFTIVVVVFSFIQAKIMKYI